MKRIVAVGGLALAILGAFRTAPAAHAAEVAYGYGYIGEYSTNIDGVPGGGRKEWINALIGGLVYQEAGADLAARVEGLVELRDYSKGTFSDEVVGTVDAAAVWTISPERLTWSIENAFRTVTLDPTQAPTPRNWASANSFETGPDAFLRFGGRNTLALGARYGALYVGDSDIDNDRYTGIVRWLYRASARTVWSLNFERERVDFENEIANENFDRDDLYLRVQARGARSLLTFDIGRTRIDRQQSEDLDGSLARIEWRREIGTESAFGLALFRAYQDAGMDLLEMVESPSSPVSLPSDLGTDVVSGDLYYTRQAELFHLHRSSRLTSRVNLLWRERDFETTPNDRDERGISIELGYPYSATLLAVISGEYLKVDYRGLDRQDEDIEYGLRVMYRLTRTVSLGFDARRIERESTDPASEFVDKRYLISIIYSSGGLFAPLDRR